MGTDRSVAVGESAEALYRRHAGRLTGIASLLLSDRARAEEVVQDAFVALLRARGPRRPAPGAEAAWLRRVVVNGCTAVVRRRMVARRHPPVAEPDAAGVDEGPDPLRRARVVAAVHALPDRQRTCTVLRFYDDLGDDEIAHVLGISPGAVKSHLHRARAALRASLEADAPIHDEIRPTTGGTP